MNPLRYVNRTLRLSLYLLRLDSDLVFCSSISGLCLVENVSAVRRNKILTKETSSSLIDYFSSQDAA